VLAALIGFAFGALAVLGGLTVRGRVRDARARNRPRLDDEAVRRIVETGRWAEDDEPPLDLDEIDDEEERFWAEEWDEPEEW
jgi:hypothetical protein